MNYPAASCGVSKTARNEASFGEYDPERFKGLMMYKKRRQDHHEGQDSSRPCGDIPDVIRLIFLMMVQMI